MTRPNNRVTQLANQLKQLSGSGSNSSFSLVVEHFPLITIIDDENVFSQNHLNKQSFDGVIFISGNAIDQAKKQLNNHSTANQDNWKALLKNPLYAIGEQTALLLKQELTELSLNTSVYSPKQMNSEGLLALPELTDIKSQTWLIVKGVGGRKKLKEGLQTAGANVLELDVYQRQLPDLIAQRQIASYNERKYPINDLPRPIWLITSLQALDNLWRINKSRSLNCQLIVSSNRIANEAVQKGFKIVAQSIDATDKELVHCVQQIIQSQS